MEICDGIRTCGRSHSKTWKVGSKRVHFSTTLDGGRGSIFCMHTKLCSALQAEAKKNATQLEKMEEQNKQERQTMCEEHQRELEAVALENSNTLKRTIESINERWKVEMQEQVKEILDDEAEKRVDEGSKLLDSEYEVDSLKQQVEDISLRAESDKMKVNELEKTKKALEKQCLRLKICIGVLQNANVKLCNQVTAPVRQHAANVHREKGTFGVDQ